MFKERRQSHELSERHYRQVLCRPRAVREQMHRVWGVTWRPGDRGGSFLGKLFRPLGSPLMMVQVSHSPEEGREGIALFGVSAEIHPQDGSVSYDSFRMRHEFHRLPFVGAKGITLDPSDDCHGKRTHGSWVRLALEVDLARNRALSRRRLPTAPLLPDVYFGYHRQEDAAFEVTPSLRWRACHGLEMQGSGQFSSAVAEAREQAFASLPEETQQVRLQEAWNAAFIPPTDPTNSTGLWLLPQELSRNVFATAQIFEYFGDLVGKHIFNPARELVGRAVPNPAVEVARAAGIDLVGDLGLLANTTEGATEFQQIEQQLIGMIPAFRQRISASEAVSDRDLLSAICQYDQQVAIEPALQSLPEVEQVRALRERLKPQHRDCCTDEDLLAAGRDPNGPLLASGLCRVQVLNRDVQQPLAEALSFSPDAIGRERVQCCLWLNSTPLRPEVISVSSLELAAAA